MTVSAPKLSERHWCADTNRWIEVRRIIGNERLTLGPQASQQWLDAPEHLAMVLARYRAAAALIGSSQRVLELGCGEGIGARILAAGRDHYCGIDSDLTAIVDAPDLSNGRFVRMDLFARRSSTDYVFDGVVSLDVIEHISAEREHAFVEIIRGAMAPHGVCVIGTPSKHAESLASPQSKAGHVNLYTPERLQMLMARYFHVVQMLYLQDVAIHLGHPGMAHYIMAVGIGAR